MNTKYIVSQTPCGCLVGIFAPGETEDIKKEKAKGYDLYYMPLPKARKLLSDCKH